MDIEEAHNHLVDEINEGYSTLCTDGPIDEFAYVYEDLAGWLAAIGICYLLTDVDVEAFRARLVRSGHARRYYLQRCQIEQVTDDYHLALSRTNAFLAALAAGHLNVAREIAALSPTAFSPAWEDVEDYAFMALLHAIVLDSQAFPTADQQARLDDFIAAEEKGPRVDAMKALFARDADAYRKALLDLMEKEQLQVDDDRTSNEVIEGDAAYWPNSHVSILGLAMLKLGELIGLTIPNPIPRCPPVARLDWTNFDYEDYFDLIARS